MRRDLPAKLHDGSAGLAGEGTSPGASARGCYPATNENLMSKWNPSSSTLASIRSASRALEDHFDAFIAMFNESNRLGESFGGPSLYFHFQSIARYANVPVSDKLDDPRFFEYVLATLTSWGMHRMGKTATKLPSLGPFRDEILKYRDAIKALDGIKIWKIDELSIAEILHLLTPLVDSMRISLSSSHLVANSKTLHHILPDLIPPIDRSNTLAFYGINTMLPSQKPAGSIFEVLFPYFVRSSLHLHSQIASLISLENENWHTSYTKVIDNAIIGAMNLRNTVSEAG